MDHGSFVQFLGAWRAGMFSAAKIHTMAAQTDSTLAANAAAESAMLFFESTQFKFIIAKTKTKPINDYLIKMGRWRRKREDGAGT